MSLKNKSKQALLHVGRAIGLFSIARQLTRSGLRILCYHGFALKDENLSHPKLFVTPKTFRSRLEYLRRSKYPVLPLQEALDLLDRGQLPPASVVITIDDGFCGTCLWACDQLRQFSFPATIYATTYYSLKGNPVFRLCVQYIFWKTRKTEIGGATLGLEWLGNGVWRSVEERSQIMWDVIRHGETACDEESRKALCRKLAENLEVDFDQILANRLMTIMSPEELRKVSQAGMDIQLHTHRHTFPVNREIAIKEIHDNRAVLEPLVGRCLKHFCYPSGFFAPQQWEWIQEEDIRSATTCMAGLNYRSTHRLALHRFLDGENISSIEFEAELSGFLELARRVRGFMNQLLGQRTKDEIQTAYSS